MSFDADLETVTRSEGSTFRFLTPKRKSASLLTPLTKAQTISAGKLTPLYTRSVSSPASSRLQDICQQVFLTKNTNNSNTQSETISNSLNPASVINTEKSDKSSVKQKLSYKGSDENFLLPPDRAVPVCEETILVKQQFTPLNSSSPFATRQENGIIPTKRWSRDHSASFCSTCSGEESLNAQSRCSTCDRCSYNTSEYQVSQTREHDRDLLDLENEIKKMSTEKWADKTPEQIMTDDLLVRMKRDVLSVSDSGFHESVGQPSENMLEHLEDKMDLSPSKEQLMFLLLRILVAKYKYLLDDVSHQRKVSASQKKTIVCLIQSVLLLVKKVKTSEETFLLLQRELDMLKRERWVYQKQQRRMFLCLCAILTINVLNVSAVRDKIIGLVRFFGVVETVKKINRTRHMIADNWRNIPSLLTEFWRLFIFRSQLRLKKS